MTRVWYKILLISDGKIDSDNWKDFVKMKVFSPQHLNIPFKLLDIEYKKLPPGTTSGVGTAYPSEHLSSLRFFSGVRVTRSLALCVCFVDHCLSFCTFSFGYCVVCSSIYGF
jgi:hypothetical protein